jgi:hypothetical protein
VHVTGFEIDQLEGEMEFIVNVLWGPQTEALAARMERTEQRTPIVERAAIALAALLLCHLVSDSDLEVLKQGDRADYWLREKHLAVEISGTERARQLPRRRREKRRQVLENAYGMDGYAIICCFEDGRRIVEWSYHSQPE